MSANQEAMRASIKAASVAKIDTVIVAVATAQSTIAAAGIPSGYRPGFPTNYAAFAAAVTAANTQKQNDVFAAESARQAAVFIAKDLLRSQGEIAF